MRIVIVSFVYEHNERNGRISFGSNWYWGMSDGDALLALRKQLDKEYPNDLKHNFQWSFNHVTEDHIRNIAKGID